MYIAAVHHIISIINTIIRRDALAVVAPLYTWPCGMVMAAGVTMETVGELKKELTGIPSICACWVSCPSSKEPAGLLARWRGHTSQSRKSLYNRSLCLTLPPPPPPPPLPPSLQYMQFLKRVGFRKYTVIFKSTQFIT